MTDDERLLQAIAEIDRLVPNARAGLPLPLFYLASRLTPMVNVDLLIRNPDGAVLLTWRDDRFYSGWHVPGGIIRFKETAAERVRAVAAEELGATVEADAAPIEVHEKQHRERDVRGHFIALLFRARLISGPSAALECADEAQPAVGQWAWHRTFPERMIPQHAVYRHLFTP